MLSIDLLGGGVWQRCWDSECVVRVPPARGGEGRAVELKAKHRVCRLPAAEFPTWEEVHAFELAHANDVPVDVD
jgi:hypothetical protein